MLLQHATPVVIFQQIDKYCTVLCCTLWPYNQK